MAGKRGVEGVDAVFEFLDLAFDVVSDGVLADHLWMPNWQADRNATDRLIDWQLTTDDTRIKLR